MVSYSKFLKVLLSFSILLSPVMFINSANASTLAGGSGWRVASTVANGIGVTVNGVKDIIVNGASKTVTGVANVTPTASQVGKFMGKNVGAAAVIGAMDLLLDGVDYVLDPANNQIVYSDRNTPNAGVADNYDYGTTFTGKTIWYSTKTLAINSAKSWINANVENILPEKTVCTNPSGNLIQCTIVRTFNSNPLLYINESLQTRTKTIPVEQPERKTIPLIDIGSQVLDKAEEELRTGNPAVPIATPVTQAAATAVVGEAATDDAQARPITAELDKSAAIPTDQTAVGEIAPPTTNPDTGEVKPGSISLDFPVFCSWAPSMCVLADKAQEAITDAREWVKESETTDTELEIPEQEQQEIDTNINFNGSCPAKITLVNFNYHNNQQNWEVDFTEWCSAVTTYIRPIVISMGAFSAVLIVSGVRINE